MSTVAPRSTEALPFRFDAAAHEYLSVDSGEVYPHITGMLQTTGWVDAKWYTAESRDRGSAVHRLTTDFDLGAIGREDLPLVNSIYKGWLMAHVSAMDIIRPTWDMIETPMVHSVHHYGGRLDRGGMVYKAFSVVELKSGGPEKAHAIQLALQAILASEKVNLPAETIPRYGLYLKSNGKFKLELFPDTRRDFAEARRVIARCCR